MYCSHRLISYNMASYRGERCSFCKPTGRSSTVSYRQSFCLILQKGEAQCFFALYCRREKRSVTLPYTVKGRSVVLFCLIPQRGEAQCFFALYCRGEKRSVILPYTVEGRSVVLFCLILQKERNAVYSKISKYESKSNVLQIVVCPFGHSSHILLTASDWLFCIFKFSYCTVYSI